MGLYVLDNVKLYEADEDNLVHLAFGDSVWTGCQVVAHGSPDMGVRVGAGSIRYAGLNKSVAQTDLTVSASDPTNPRIDLVHIAGTTGVPAIVAGTAASTPKPPALPAASILVGFVSVAAAAVNVGSSNITDRRLLASDGVVGGTDANKPAAGFAGRLYAARDTGILYHDDGSSLAPLGTPPQPNLIVNSDFGRRTVFAQSMIECFPDTNGYLQRDGGASPTVSGGVLTQSAANNVVSWPKSAPSNFWRDCRFSATFKAVATAGRYSIMLYVDGNNNIEVRQSAGNFALIKSIAGTPTTVATVALALTLNNWYWLEIERQGTTIIIKIYNTGGAAAGVTKASSTLLQTLTGTVADAAVAASDVCILSDQSNAAWGGFAAAPGGVYVETWLPESWTASFDGALGGQAVVFDEATDAGPIGKQWALRGYVPPAATARRAYLSYAQNATGIVVPSGIYTQSIYWKTSGIAAGNSSFMWRIAPQNTAGGDVTSYDITDVQETAWTRRTQTNAWGATAKSFRTQIFFNAGLATNQGGTYWVSLLQLEQGSFATPWRNAPADDSPIVFVVPLGLSIDATTTSATYVEVNSRDFAANPFLPWDCRLEAVFNGAWQDSIATLLKAAFSFDGSISAQDGFADTPWSLDAPNAVKPMSVRQSLAVAAGKHRVALNYLTGAGTLTVPRGTYFMTMRLIAYRGK